MSAEIAVQVDPANPGQYFACCGLLELADRLWGSAEGWFEESRFRVSSATERGGSLPDLMAAVAAAPLHAVDSGDEAVSPLDLPRFALRLDWWQENAAGCRGLKTWAGSMKCARIARAMQAELAKREYHGDDLFDRGSVVYDPAEPDKKVEPFYFDARRGANARSLDVGFAPDPLGITVTAYPAVEFLCLVGLQRFRPTPTAKARVFRYQTWCMPMPPLLAALATCGLASADSGQAFQFENAFRTDQRKHKAFVNATPVSRVKSN